MKKLILLIQVFSVFFLSSHVYATQIQLNEDNWKATFFAFNYNNDLDFDDEDPISQDFEYDNSRFAGQFNVNFLDPSGAITQSTKGFCIDLTTPYANGDASITGLSGLTNWGSVAWLLDKYWLDTNDAYMNAALQMAVWDTIYGDNRFYMSAYGNNNANFLSGGSGFSYAYFLTIRSHYEKYITAIGTTSTSSQYRILNFAENQDIIIKNPVPEPATMLLFGFGLLGLGAMGRKKE
jgi:hypothetical protein